VVGSPSASHVVAKRSVAIKKTKPRTRSIDPESPRPEVSPMSTIPARLVGLSKCSGKLDDGRAADLGRRNPYRIRR